MPDNPFEGRDLTAEKPASDLVSVQITTDEAKAWLDRVEKAEKRMEQYHRWWDQALKNYAPSVEEDPSKYMLEVRTNRAFGTVERKSADLCYQRPEFAVTPSPLIDALPQGAQMAAVHANIVNEKLGTDGVDLEQIATEAIFAYELFGIGPTKMGYKVYSKDVTRPKVNVETGQPEQTPALDQRGQMVMDPTMGGPVMQPVMETVPVPIKTECFWEAFSPKQWIIPADWRSTNYDKAPFQGWRFEMSLNEAKRIYGKEHFENFERRSKEDKNGAKYHFEHGTTQSSADVVCGVELYYLSHIFREDIAHPDHLTQIVFIDGLPEPVLHRDCQDQTFAPDGSLTADSLIGYPFHPLCVRVLTDAPIVMSDVAIGLPQTQELDKHREQDARRREQTLMRGFYNSDLVTPDEMKKAVSQAQGGMMPMRPEFFSGQATKWLDPPNFPPENAYITGEISADYDRGIGIDATAAGVNDPSAQTATQSSLRQANSNIRTGKEQGKVAKWAIKGVTKFSTLLQRYVTPEQAAAVVGPEAAQLWKSWTQVIPTRLAFQMVPDSALRNDTPLDRKQHQDLYTFLANDPTINRQYMNERLLLKYHLDPTKALLPPDQRPGEPKPDPAKFVAPIKIEDLNPLSPTFPIAVDLYQQGTGLTINPQAIQQAVELAAALRQDAEALAATENARAGEQQPHGGKVPAAESLDRHQNQKTGGMQNTGELVPGMAGGLPSGAVN